MGYSKDYHFIFIRPEKTGGTSIDKYLHDNCKTYNIQDNIHKSTKKLI